MQEMGQKGGSSLPKPGLAIPDKHSTLVSNFSESLFTGTFNKDSLIQACSIIVFILYPTLTVLKSVMVSKRGRITLSGTAIPNYVIHLWKFSAFSLKSAFFLNAILSVSEIDAKCREIITRK